MKASATGLLSSFSKDDIFVADMTLPLRTPGSQALQSELQRTSVRLAFGTIQRRQEAVDSPLSMVRNVAITPP